MHVLQMFNCVPYRCVDSLMQWLMPNIGEFSTSHCSFVLIQAALPYYELLFYLIWQETN